MARTALLAAGVFSLILVGNPGETQAGTNPANSADTNHGYINLFGRTICSAHAPPLVQCDWRMPNLAGTHKEGDRSLAFALFGRRYCAGKDVEGHCDFRFVPAAKPEPKSKVFSILGMNLCFGDASSDTDCYLKLPAATSKDGELRASL